MKRVIRRELIEGENPSVTIVEMKLPDREEYWLIGVDVEKAILDATIGDQPIVAEFYDCEDPLKPFKKKKYLMGKPYSVDETLKPNEILFIREYNK